MDKFIYLALLIFLVSCQNLSEQQSESLEKTPSKTKTIDEIFAKNDSIFLDMIQKEVVIEADEKKYISDIKELQSVKLIHRDSTSVHYKDVIDGKEIELKLSVKDFEKSKHKITYKTYEDNSHKDCELIDYKSPYGGYYGCPKTEIRNLSIMINGQEINTKDAFDDIYNIDLSNREYWEYFHPNPTLKYDKINQVFCLYIYGGNAADTYFGKFIFNEEEYIKRYILHYVQLSKTGSFRRNFKGF